MDRSDFSFWRSLAVGSCLAGAFFSPAAALADTFTLDLSSPAYLDKPNSTALWNITNKRIQAPYTVTPAGTAYVIDFGDGSDGAFSDGPAQPGISVSGNTITIDTNTKNKFQFTSFNLSATMTLKLTGNNPATILVMGSTTIAGTVQLNGNPGLGNNGQLGNLGSFTTGSSGPNAGGSGGNGGGSGGTGAVQTGIPAATQGTPAVSVTNPAGGGFGVGSATPAPGGGGGGCIGVGPDTPAGDATAGTAAGGTPGGTNCSAVTRTTLANAFETSFFAGAGGGGGGGGGNGGIFFISGGGGGGGGGALHFNSYQISVTGPMNALGGTGGNYDWENNPTNALANCATTAGCGGGGAGGSGGNIWIQTQSIVTGTGAINVSGGAGGSSGSICCTGSANGGAGSRGILRADSSAGSFTAVTPATAPTTNVASIPASGNYVAVSRAIDLSQGVFSLTGATETWDTASAGCGAVGTYSVIYEGSNDGVTFEHPVAKALLPQLNDYPFIRFKVSYAYSGGTPACLTGLQITYDQTNLADLKLKGGLFCGSMRKSRPGSPGSPSPRDIAGDLLMIGLAALLGRGFRRIKPAQAPDHLPVTQ